MDVTAALGITTLADLQQFNAQEHVRAISTQQDSTGKYYWLVWIAMDGSNDLVDGWATAPWTLLEPNTQASSGPLQGFSISGNDLTAVSNEIWNSYQKPIYYNLELINTDYSNLISTNNFNIGDFQYYQLDIGGGILINPIIAILENTKVTELGTVDFTWDSTYDYPVKRTFTVLTGSPQFNTRCCSNLVTAAGKPFCGLDFTSSDSGSCVTLMNNYCGPDAPAAVTNIPTLAAQARPDTNLNPVCGCYSTYIEKNIVDANPTLKSTLESQGLSLPSGCAGSCAGGTFLYWRWYKN